MTDARAPALRAAVAAFRDVDLPAIGRGQLPRICEPINQWEREPWCPMSGSTIRARKDANARWHPEDAA